MANRYDVWRLYIGEGNAISIAEDLTKALADNMVERLNKAAERANANQKYAALPTGQSATLANFQLSGGGQEK